jgi:Notch-like protein
MRNLNKNSFGDINRQIGHSQQWSDDESEMPQPKRMRGLDLEYSSDHTIITDYEEADPRVWSQQHMEAADIRVPPAMMTPPNHHDGNNEVDIRGPCGMTPLMVASVRGGGIDSGEEIEVTEDSTAQIISELVAQGAELNATMDKTGETSLHLAARYARADAAKRLLDAGADANSQDNTGRTPLHAAVAADAMGVFQILLRNRATNLNARMHDGTTPLILAARLAIEGMVEDLINADSDINAADNSGKTALHWAAAVNNVEAVNILLLHGANRDAQDDKDETPLFLAAREGSFEACKALLDNFANREITDHMDRLPRDVAAERLHHDIIRLLDDHVPRSPQQLVTVIPNQIMTSPSSHQLISQPTVIPAIKQSKPKKQRQKLDTPTNGGVTSPEPAENVVKQRKPSVKKSNKKQTISVEKSASAGRDLAAQNSGTNSANSINKNSTAVIQESQLQEIEDLLSSVESPATNIPSPYDTTSIYSNAMAAFDIEYLDPSINNNNNNTTSTNNNKKKPPSYEECIKVSNTNFYFFY